MGQPRPPAKSAAQREMDVIGLAYDAAEKQIREGRASSQVLTHFLKLGTEREKLEREKIANENALLHARVEQIAQQGQASELFAEAIRAFSSYAGRNDEVADDQF